MNILCILHADFETPGVIEDWARLKQFPFQITRPYCGDRLPDITPFEMLVVMGGPQSPLKLDEFPYLAAEIALIQSAISQEKKILGFCLGAQLIGEALGASTEQSPEKELGVYPIQLTPEGRHDPLLEGFEPSFPVIHWHNDMPGLTPEAETLAFSQGCPRQIVRYLPSVYGFQCHLEITHNGIKTMIQAVPEDLAPSRFTQTQEILLSQDYAVINQYMHTILNRFYLR